MQISIGWPKKGLGGGMVVVGAFSRVVMVSDGQGRLLGGGWLGWAHSCFRGPEVQQPKRQ